MFDGSDYLFHYTTTSVFIEKILKNLTLRLSSISEFSDPYEYNTKVTGAIGGSSVNVDDVNKELCSRYRIACFSRNLVDDQKEVVEGWGHPKMWSEFADSGKGVCIVFSKEKLLYALAEEYKGNLLFTDSDKLGSDVKYVDALHDINAQNIDAVSAKFYGDAHAQKHIDDNFKFLFYTKHSDYKCEAEYRIVVGLKKPADCYIPISSAIQGLIIGDRFDQVYIPSIEEILKSNNLTALPLQQIMFINSGCSLFNLRK